MTTTELPPVRVNVSLKRASAIPGYKGHVHGTRDEFGSSYGTTTANKVKTESLLKPTTRFVAVDEIERPNRTGALQATHWTKTHKPSGRGPVSIATAQGPFETTNSAAYRQLTAKEVERSAKPIYCVPGYSGHVHQMRESFGATMGKITEPLKDQASLSTTSTVLDFAQGDGVTRTSKGLQVHTPFTVDLTPRDTADPKRYLEKTGQDFGSFKNSHEGRNGRYDPRQMSATRVNVPKLNFAKKDFPPRGQPATARTTAFGAGTAAVTTEALSTTKRGQLNMGSGRQSSRRGNMSSRSFTNTGGAMTSTRQWGTFGECKPQLKTSSYQPPVTPRR